MNSRSQLTYGAILTLFLTLIHASQAVQGTAARLSGGVDAVLDAEDPLPFLALHYGQVGPLCQTWHGQNLGLCSRPCHMSPVLPISWWIIGASMAVCVRPDFTWTPARVCSGRACQALPKGHWCRGPLKP